MKRVIVDLTCRVSLNGRTNLTYAGFEDVIGEVRPAAGESVTVIEIDTGISSDATVVTIDAERRLLYLKVNWDALLAP